MATQRVAFQGEPGAYGEMAALDYFPRAKLLPAKSFQNVFEILESGKADFAVVPIENSIEGSINETYDLLFKTSMVVYGEIHQRIRHCLIVNPGIDESDIRCVYSHPQALAQCRIYLQKKSLEEGIEDKKNNYTRFLVLSKAHAPKPTGHDGTSIIFSVRHIPGALYSILEEFAKRRINLTKIESRPTKEVPWEYNFYVDFEGHSNDKEVKELIRALKKKTLFIKILGSYKRGRSH